MALLDSDTYDKSTAVVLAIDLEKAFDSLEWGFLYATMEKFGLRGGFLNWTKLLYTSPVARVKTGGVISDK